MTFDIKRIYYNAVFGALGGLVSWALVGLVLRFQTQSTFLLFVKDALQGAVVGLCIGLALGVVDGLTVSRSVKRTVRGGFLGAAIGLGAGLVGLVLGEVIFLVAGGGVWPRAIGWALFGLLVGTSEGVVNVSPNKASYGVVGGLLGGLIGGSTYERLSIILRAVTHNRDLSLTVGGAVGLIILGACIGSLIALAEGILRPAWLKVVYGRLEGRTLTLAKQKNVLGKSDGCDIVIPGDPQVANRHAEIRQEGRQFVLAALAHDVPTLIETPQGKQPVTEHILQSGARIQLGKTRMIFQIKEGGDR
jgi:CDP-diglyceride synthetase